MKKLRSTYVHRGDAIRRRNRLRSLVVFVGISGATAVGSAVSDDAYATVRNGSGGSFIVTMHPAGRDDRADMAFTLIAG